MQVWFLGWDDPLEEGMATHSSILAWRIPWTVEPGRLQSIGLQRIRHNWSDLACVHLRGGKYIVLLFEFIFLQLWASLVAKMVKNLPATQKTWIWSLDRKDPLEKSMVIHSSILAWRIPRTEEPGGLQSMGSPSQSDWATNTFTFLYLLLW